MNKSKSSSPFTRVAAFFALILGRINWSSPPWINYFRLRSKTHPKAFWTSFITLFVLLGMGVGTYYWYSQLPKPQLITANITTPKAPFITEEEEIPPPDPLTIVFGLKTEGQEELTPQSVAPLDLVGKEVTKGVEITPSIPGKWYWSNDNQLLFSPTDNWPAEQKYTVRFNKDFFAKNAHMEDYAYTFITPSFQAKITDFTFYQDPVDPKLRQAVGTIHFNYPVDPQSMEKNTVLSLEALKNQKIEPKYYHFNITFDKQNRIAYLRSEPITLTDTPKYLILEVKPGVHPTTGKGELGASLSKNLLIPDISNYLKINAAKGEIVRDAQDRPEQILAVETTLGVTEKELLQHMHVYLLPKDYPASAIHEERKDYEWTNPGEVNPTILALSQPLALESIPAEFNYSTLHTFRFSAQTPRYAYVKIDKGLRGLDNFKLSNNFATIIKVPEYPKEIRFLHKGALLSLSGEKKLSALIRGVPAVKFSFARILPQDINQLVTQTQGDFNNPYFINSNFNQQNISEIFSEIQQFNASDNKQQYTSLDFEKYLANAANSGGPQGLFLLHAQGWDSEKNEPIDVSANRLVLITDLAMIVKDNQDGSHDVFVQSISQGIPQANVTITVLGKNGLPILSVPTDMEGRANFPSLKDYIEEKEPVVYLAALGTDVSFIPYNNSNRQLNFSRYDVGGLYTSNQELNSLSAYLFSDRGIYRPGDTAHLGIILKQAYAAAQPPGLTVQLSISDPRGTVVSDKKFSVDELGYLTYDFLTQETSPTGQYYANLYLVKDDHPENYLGSVNFKVAEFQPDRMRIQSSFSSIDNKGWVSPDNLLAKVVLWNLYGAPAADRKIAARILLEPKIISFVQYPEYIFFDPLLDTKKQGKVFTDTLKDQKTNGQGETVFNLNLQRFAKASYQLTFFAEGFEAEGGRSVTTQSSVLVSPLPYFIGFKSDGDLQFIKQNSQRSVNYLAINPQLNPIALSDLKIQLVSLQPVSTLVKKADGTYQYQSIMQSKVIKTEPLTLTEQGLNYALPTQNIGNYALNILDKNNTEISQLKFSVVGDSQQSLARNAELSVKLNKEAYAAGEDIELQITAPYVGTGLITIEREKVYVSKWFKTETTSSLQTIHIPEDFQGNGYVNVAFVRDWNSPEIFINPLSYSVVPFSVDSEIHKVNITLNTASEAKPGDNFAIEYATDKPGKIIVFAVDEGILQVARYAMPEPLAFFFQKRALEVITQQTVDQILPKFIRERELSSVGGDGGEDLLSQYLNPFKRKTDLPVVFWSGLLESDANVRKVSYPIPDYFNGTLHVMAVAVSLDAVGSSEKKAEVKGDFIINPNVPTFVSPGDEFEVTASIANNLKNAGEDPIGVNLEVSPELQVVTENPHEIIIPAGKEAVIRYRLRALNQLGNATLTFSTRKGDKEASIISSLSIRPATAFSTTVISGRDNDEKRVVDLRRALYPEFRTVTAALSSSPLILAAGLQRYLDNFPYGCTEQLISKAFPLLIIGDQHWLTDNPQEVEEKVKQTISLLAFRQMTNGSFTYWPGSIDNQNNQFISVYAMHFLTEAYEYEYSISDEMYDAGLDYLMQLASANATSLEMARNQAYAIYILTRNQVVTSNYITNLILYLDKSYPSWKQEIIGAYIAASFKLLKNDKEAEQLIRAYQPNASRQSDSDFYDQNSANAQYLYLLGNHFPALLEKQDENLVLEITSKLNSDEINTIFSSYGILGLGSYAAKETDAWTGLSIAQKLANNNEPTLLNLNDNYGVAPLSENAIAAIFLDQQRKNYFYQVTESGFDKNIPKESVAQGIEVYREYRSKEGQVINTTSLGEEIEVHIQIRGLSEHYLSNIVILDLLPGGFEVVQDSIKKEITYMDYFDIREDRVIFFGSIDSNSREIVYRIKATNVGTFTVPAIQAESMYNPKIKANGVGSSISVVANDKS
ncbi:Alpha-2-macroglobulin (plasmid) [Legionella adelaidensis]|uniref:Alpha-2-macroglobulin n=1 Tax=Legionella adelaidensis TaxID=45056 RepID=A0A0W0R1A9_9GAMM|nr:alpha-2-macroglobulin [Legionella adelaidensis]KTC64870.1 hypothetical protein Lade_2164 [Legionella adelaidensis]VEH82959.1 Alpha-2-macroglobulin [Legionella adelaidensis]